MHFEEFLFQKKKILSQITTRVKTVILVKYKTNIYSDHCPYGVDANGKHMHICSKYCYDKQLIHI